MRHQRCCSALLIVIVAACALSWSQTGPVGAQHDHEPDPQVIADVWGYAAETDEGFAHVLRWVRVLHTFDAIEDMTAAEAQGYADQHLASRWDPVVAELGNLESAQGGYEPDPQVVAAVRGYAAQTDNGFDHVLRWVRVLHTFGAIEDMTATEAQGYADRGWPRWVPVAAELAELESSSSGAVAEFGELGVSITASPVYPRPGELVQLSAVVSNAPSGSEPSYHWELTVDGGNGITLSRSATASYGQGAGTMTFRVTVSYGTGDSATATRTVEWTDTPPNAAPVVNTGARWHDNFTGRANAPRGSLVWKIFSGIFSDPDGDELTYTASVPDGHSGLVEDVSFRLGVGSNYGDELDYLFFMADSDDDWGAASPALADPLLIPVTVTATDPDGLSVSVTGEFLTDWDSHPTLETATAAPTAVTLTFDQELQIDPAPGPGQFTVNLTNEDGSAGTVAVSGVSVSGSVVTLELASALQAGQTVTVDYAHHDDAPLTRAAGGGDNAPGFTGQAVEVTLPEPVVAAPDGLSLSPTLDADGNPVTNSITASWDPVPDAAYYTLSWRPDDAGSPAQTQPRAGPGIARKSGIPFGPSGAFGRSGAFDDGLGTKDAQSGPSANSGPGQNQLHLPGDRTNADITVNDGGIWRVYLEIYDANGKPITAYSETADVTSQAAPALQTATVNGATLTLTYDVALDANSVPAATAFTVKGIGADRNPSHVSIAGTAVTLTLDTAATVVQTVTLTYVKPPANPIQDVNGEEAFAFTDQAVTNNTPDTVPPSLSSAAVNAASLTLTYNETLDADSKPAATAFTVKGAGDDQNPTNVTIDGRSVTLTLDRPAAHGETVTVTYTVASINPLRDAPGNEAAGFTDRAVTDRTPPSTTLVANTGQTTGNDGRGITTDVAQAFTTGSHAGGYTLTKATIGLFLGFTSPTPPDYTVTVRNASGNNPGSTVLGTLTKPPASSLPAAFAPVEFTAPGGGIDLAAGTTYFLVWDVTNTRSASGALADTVSDAEDSGKAAGWSIGNGARFRDHGGGTWDTTTDTVQIQIHGYAKDRTAPVLSSAAVNGAAFTLTYDEALDTDSVPAASAFTVKVGGNAVTVGDVTIADNTVTLTLGTAVSPGAPVTVSYAAPDLNPIQDGPGNDAAGFDDEPATNRTGEKKLVANTGQASNSSGNGLGRTAAQAFTTGSNTGGYTLTNVVIKLALILTTREPKYTVTIRNESNGVPGSTILGTLTNPPSLMLPTLDVDYPASGGGIDLAADTTYFLVWWVSDTNYTQGHLYETASNAEDTGAAASWGLADGYKFKGIFGQAGWDSTSDTLQIQIHGYAKDRTAPVLSSAAVNGTVLTLTYDEALDADSEPATTAFTVKVGGNAVTVGEVTIADNTVTLTLGTAATSGQTVTVSYDTSAANPLRDANSNNAAGLDDEPAANATPPELSSAAVNGTALTLTYDGTLDTGSKPAATAFTVKVNNSAVTVGDVAIAGKVVTLTLGTAATSGQTVTVSYDASAANPLRDANSNNAADLDDHDVANATPPELHSAAVNEAALTLIYDGTLDADSRPAASAFTVKGIGADQNPTGISIAGKVVTLTLGTAATSGQTVTVSYDASAANPLRDANDNNAAGLTDQAVINRTGGITLVSNTGQTPVSEGDLAGDNAQAFTTGSNSGGYRLTRVEIPLRRTTTEEPTYTVTIRDASGNNPGSTVVGTLTNPASLPATLTNVEFAASGGGIDLDANTTYFVVWDVTAVNSAEGDVGITQPDGEDTGTAPGWSIANSGLHRDFGDTAWTSSNLSRQIALHGFEKPSVTALTVSSSAGADNAYAIGDTISFTVAFNEHVTVTTSGTPVEGPRIPFALGMDTKHAVYASGSGTAELEFSYEVVAGDADADGVAVVADALELNGGAIKDLDGFDASLTHAALAAQPGHTVDGVRPTLSGAAVNGVRLTLAYNEALYAAPPATSAFTVKGIGADQKPRGVFIVDRTVTLILGRPARDGDTVTVTYTAPVANPIADANGSEASALTDQAVTNNTSGNPRPPPPEPAPEKVEAAARELLADDLKVGVKELTLEFSQEVPWSDASLGCPQQGWAYAQVLTPGYLLIFDLAGTSYAVHTNSDGSHMVICRDR